MLRNIVFDMGNVLIRYEPEYFIERLGIADPGDRRLLMDAVFCAPEWALQDRGDVTEAQMDALARERLPERLHAPAHRLIFGWEQPMEPIPGMAALIADCKRAGLGVYLLSNASLRQREYWPLIPGHEHFDGRIVSAEHRCLKPDAAIYRVLLDTYRLRAEECLFVDDVAENVQAAERLGMAGFHFMGDAAVLRSAIRALGVAL